MTRTILMLTLLGLPACTSTRYRVANSDEPNQIARAVEIRFCEAWDEPQPEALQMVDENGKTLFVSTSAFCTKEDLELAELSEQYEGISIALHFTPAGREKMSTYTERHQGGRIAILIDGRLVSAPRIIGQIGSTAMIEGAFSREWAQGVVDSLESR